MVRHRTVEQFIDLDAAEQQVHIVFPRETDPAVDLQSRLGGGGRSGACERDRGGHRPGACYGIVPVECDGGGPECRAGASVVVAMFAQWCFTAWKLPITVPNCVLLPT